MVVLGIDCWDGSQQFVENFKNSTSPPLTYPLLLNGSQTMQNYQIVYDYSTIIDRQGILRFKAAGVPLQEIQQTIDGLLATAIDQPKAPVRTFRLIGNFPNPFNPFTTIRFELHKSQQIELQIFDLNGRLVRQLVKGTLPAGLHQVQWDGRDDRQKPLPSGSFFYRLSAEGQQTKKMLLIK